MALDAHKVPSVSYWKAVFYPKKWTRKTKLRSYSKLFGLCKPVPIQIPL